MGRLVDWLLGLSGGAVYAVVGLLAFGEAAAFVGLLLPGEAAVLLGGVLAAQGRVSLWVMLGVACTAAVLGDSAGYEIGRHTGPRILRWRLLRGPFAGHVEHAQAYLDEHGGRAVFLGRWTSVLRALVPGLAGVARMPYRRFLAFNLAGGRMGYGVHAPGLCRRGVVQDRRTGRGTGIAAAARADRREPADPLAWAQGRQAA